MLTIPKKTESLFTRKLNLGCGNRYSKFWINIDFNSTTPEVMPCNLLEKLPFADNSIDVVYSSHFLEHFSKTEGERILAECFRILRPNGILRIVVPDLEYTCREYLRVLDTLDSNDAHHRYEWIILELLDQMVRTQSGGLMRTYWETISENQEKATMNYIDDRMGYKFREEVTVETKHRLLIDKLRGININKIKNKLTYIYINAVKKLLPNSLRESVLDDTVVGEKHKWMYDRYSLTKACQQAGFKNINILDAYTSSIPNFKDEHLDTNPDSTPYKPGSLYCEAVK
jgi:predicted SAM-dependent methyltransferase